MGNRYFACDTRPRLADAETERPFLVFLRHFLPAPSKVYRGQHVSVAAGLDIRQVFIRNPDMPAPGYYIVCQNGNQGITIGDGRVRYAEADTGLFTCTDDGGIRGYKPLCICPYQLGRKCFATVLHGNVRRDDMVVQMVFESSQRGDSRRRISFIGAIVASLSFSGAPGIFVGK